ncbi:MAG: GAF domain-containing protein [Cyanobacteria bacterium P01_G01_bin.19]
MSIQPPSSLSELTSNGSSNGSKYQSLPTDIFKKLGNLSTQAEIIQAAVEIVYQNLGCDRVVVYSMQSETMCKITAEAVTPGYAQILGTTIEDPCFEARYADKYQRGRVRAITNIREAGMSLCYVDNLEKIDVKSNLVVPLTAADGSLYGLLVMHQCSRTREWQQPEVEFVLSVAQWTMKQVAQQQTCDRLRAQVDNNASKQQFINDITKEIHQATTSEAVLQVAVEKAKELLQCDRAIVYGLQSDSLGEIVAEATIPALAPILANVIKDPCFEYRYIDKYQQGRVRAIPNIFEAGMTPCYVDNLAKIGVKANLVAPINRDDGKIYGLLVAHHCFDFKDWQESEIEFFKQIAFHTGLSLSKAKLKEQSVLVEHGLTKLNDLRDSIKLSQGKIQQIEAPVQNTNRILVEVNNLNKLLEREVNTINQTGSLQMRKNTKLIQIIIRKLASITLKLQDSIDRVNRSRNEAEAILNREMKNFRQ